jgi:hypothetical protein
MKPEDIAKYVFSEQVVDWELRAIKCRKAQLVMARQISYYLINWFMPDVNQEEVSSIFAQDRCTMVHSVKNIKNLLYSEKSLRPKVDKYLNVIRKQLNEENKEDVLEMLKSEETQKKLFETISSMEMVAKVYCDLTGMKLTNK